MGLQRRHITIVFSDISNSTHLASTLEPEMLLDLLETFRRHASEVAKRHGGEIIRIDGDGLIIIFGHQRSYEDSARRAVETALDIHKITSQFDPALLPTTDNFNLHTGIHGGVVLLRTGDNLRGKYEILGEATNIARRLCDFATANEIIISDQVLGASRSFFKTGTLTRLTLRGRSSSINVWPIHGRTRVSTRLDARSTRSSQIFVGRKSILSRLNDWAIGQNQPGCILISAGAGMGKSRLLTEYIRRSTENGLEVHYASCEFYLGGKAMQPIQQWINSIARSTFGIPMRSGDWRDHFNEVLTPESASLLHYFLTDNSKITVSQLSAIFVEILGNISKDKSVIMCLDDWQWADQATRDITLHLQSLANAKVKFLLLSRKTDDSFLQVTDTEHIKLPPLNRGESELTISNIIPNNIPFNTDKIITQSAGCPLYIEEICYALIQSAQASDTYKYNTDIASLTLSRLSELTPQQIDCLQMAAVMGFMFPQWLLKEMTGLTLTSPDFISLTRHDFLYVSDIPGTIRFKHALTRDSIYEVIDFRKRKDIHERIAQMWISFAERTGETENAGVIAFHLFHSDQFNDCAIKASKAGKDAFSASMLDIAQQNYKICLDALVSLPATDERDSRVYSALTKYGLASVTDPSNEHLDVIETVAEAYENNPNSTCLTATNYWGGFINYGMGEPKRALAKFARAQTLAKKNKQSNLSQTLNNNLAQAYAATCQYKTAKPLLASIIKHERTLFKDGHNPVSLAYSLSCEGFMLADQGFFNEADLRYDEALHLLGNKADQISMSIIDHRVASEIWRGSYDKAIEYAENVLEMTAHLKSRYHYVMAGALLNISKWLKSPQDEYIPHIVEMTAWMERNHTKQYISINYGYLSHIMVHTGDSLACRSYAARALDRSRSGDRLGDAMAYRSLAKLFAKSDKLTESKRYLQRSHISANYRLSEREISLTENLREALKL